MKGKAHTAILLIFLILFLMPLCTVYIFDCFTFQQKDVLEYLNPFYLYKGLTSDMKHMIVWLCLSGFIILLMTGKLAVLQNHNEHGSAKWASISEINKIFHKRIQTHDGFKDDHDEVGGMVVKKRGQNVWHECQSIHSLVIGTTSSGKTRKTLIPSIVVAAHSKFHDHYSLSIKVLSKQKYDKYKKRKETLGNISLFGYHVFTNLDSSFQRFYKKLCGKLGHNYKKMIMVEEEKLNLNDFFNINKLKDIDFRYRYKGKGQIDEYGILYLNTSGKVKVYLDFVINKDSMFVNDPKKELYKMFKTYLEKKGYHVVLLDLRKSWTGDCWNPMSSVIRCLEENKVDEADMYAKDIASALCPESKMSEKIWTDGERAIIAALILAVAGADCPKEQKNLYTCYQILATLGQPDEDDHVPLNDYFDGLPIGHIARTAFGPAALATDRTRMSFYVSACTTLGMFSSTMVAKQTAKSTFDMTKFSSEPTAVFLVNPDEKTNMDALANLFIDEIYRVLSIEANKTGGKLQRKFHYFWDETAAGKQPDLGKKLSIARGKNIQFHLYIQDFGQLEEIYGKEQTATIKANCNLMIYISTQNLETAKEISDKIGSKTIETSSVNEQTGESVLFMPKGSVSRSLMARPLLNPNELMKLEDGKAIVIRMRMNPMLTTLEDCSTYEFYNELQYYLDEPSRNDGPLEPYIPEINNEYNSSPDFSQYINRKM